MENLDNGQWGQQPLAETEAPPEEKKDGQGEGKAWLFKENIRLQALAAELAQGQEQLAREREKLQAETAEVRRKLSEEHRRLLQKEAFFEKKMDILKNGFAGLEEDRRKLEKDRLRLEAEKDAYMDYGMETDCTEMLFRGVGSQLALKKRYKDLVKMFHPDNIAGDHEMVLAINRAYEKLKHTYELERRA